MSEDFYKVLGVEKKASKSDIKKAFRSAAQKHHPDKGGDGEKFKKIQQAYKTLSDDEKRAQYDQFGAAGPQFSGGNPGGFSGFGNGGAAGVKFDFGGMEDIFSSFFGGGGGFGENSRAQNSDRGNDLEVELELDFDDAVRGIEKTFSSKHFISCESCGGRGGENPKTCDACGGRGHVFQKMSTPFGTVQQRVACAECGGSGISFAKKCKTCGGEGRVEKSKKISVKIPAGVQSGETVRVRGAGEAGRRNSESGDLFVHVRVRESRKFERRGVDLISVLKISFADAILGGKFPVETFWGKVDLKIPELTRDGTILRISKKGVRRGSATGDHLVRIEYEFPKKLSAHDRELLEKLTN
ncbi:DnaJ domain-containing protein [bacterium]|nr:DnaJ domain-containing protein [bacterium]MBT6831960.1 DnaJ domain-containing protein [bacterium]MBT6996656.1 DnaJ domain-containing protein [bacterium]MBT7773076.1 DnaJ domain-containing protein [bacterium]